MSGHSPAPHHRGEPIHRFDRPDQDGGADSLRLGDNINAVVHPVNEINVTKPARSEHNLASRRSPAMAVRGWLALMVGLDLDDNARSLGAGPPGLYQSAQKIPRDRKDRLLKERLRELPAVHTIAVAESIQYPR